MTELNASERQGRSVSRLILVIFLLLSMHAPAQNAPSGFDDLVLQATAAREQNNIPQAIDLYNQAVAINPKWPDGWWFLGSLQYATDAYGPARDALTHYIEINPRAGPAIALRGLCEFETGEYVQSLQDIQRGLSLGAANQPRNAEILQYHEALLLTRNGKFGDALKEYGVLSKAHAAANPDLFEGIGLAGLRTPLLPKEVKPEQRQLFMMAGEAAFYFMSGDEITAKQKLQDFFQRFHTATNAHHLYGYLLVPTDPDQAVAEFKRELQITPSNAAASLMLAWNSLIRSDPSDALIYAQKAVEEKPTFPSAQLMLGRSLVETGDAKEGLTHLQKALQAEPQNLETHIALAKAYSELGRKQDARRERLLCLQLTKDETTRVANP
ncbi:MAG: tetratricopeptide repeat protein [Terriglobales bacterium]